MTTTMESGKIIAPELPQLFTIVTIYTPPRGMTVVHSWGPYDTRKAALSAAAKMRRRHRSENSWMSTENAAIENKRLTVHVSEITDPFEVRERINGEWVFTERSYVSTVQTIRTLTSKAGPV